MAINFEHINNKDDLENALYTQNCIPHDAEEIAAAESGTEVLAFAGYKEFETAADRTAIKIKEGFMEMGYILKIARDTDILAGSGYTNVEEFAQRRYDLDKGTVSRYIRIVERFSEGGNSHILKENYKKMGFAKLSLMLHMPDTIAEELMESLSKNEVLAIKEELDAESMITDVELLIEKAEEAEAKEQTPQIPVPAESETLLTRAVYQLGKENPDIYRKIWQAVAGADFQNIPDILAPQGDAVLICRIPGTGRVMISIEGKDATITAVRTGDKEKCALLDLAKAFTALCPMTEETVEAGYRLMYGVDLEPEEPATQAETKTESKVAPVQPPKEKRKESKVTKAKPLKKEQPKQEPPAAVVETVSEEEQIPGQDSILNHPEYMPDDQVDSTEEEATNAEIDGTGVSGNDSDMSDGARGNGTAEQPGAPEGVDREPENVQEPEEDAGTGGGENQPHSVITECEGNLDMTDEEWEILWESMARDANNLYSFLRWQKDTFLLNGLFRGRLEEHYREAVNVAAGLEKMLNGKKYTP